MQVDKYTTKFAESEFEAAEATNCTEIKAKLDELSSGRFSLEKMDRINKMFLLRHLENCSACCRSFDVRMRFRPTRTATIY